MVATRLATGLAAGAATAAALRLRRTLDAVRRGRAMAARTAVFERDAGPASPALLALGDSLAVGVGAAHPEESLPGRLATEVPHLTVHNRARSGARLAHLAAQLDDAPRPRYEAILVAAGANDVIRGARLEAAVEFLGHFLAHARSRAGLVVVLTSANVGGAPILPWYLRRIFTARSRRLRDLAARACTAQAVHFVDLFAEPGRDPFARDPRRYFGADGLHPSSESYRVCAERVWAETPIAARLGLATARKDGHASC